VVPEEVVENENAGPYSLLFRATDGKTDKSKRVKISTVVDPQSLEQFWSLYTECVKTGMSGLRKKEKKKQKKEKKKATS
jgi:Signal recognition particle 14kD protein